MNNVEILSEDKILSLKTNMKEVLKEMNEVSDNSWLKDFFKEENPFTKSRLLIEDIELDMSAEDPSDTDFENAKRLYNTLRITESQACDERLWMGLTFNKFYNYMLYRYKPTMNLLKNKWFYQDTASKAQIFRQGLSMLWWYVYITYDKNNTENPYDLTEFAFKHRDLLISIYSRNFCGSKNVTLGLVRALRDFERDGGNINSKAVYNGLVKYISFLGGAYIIDIMTEKEIYDKCYIKLIDLYIKEYPDQKIFKL